MPEQRSVSLQTSTAGGFLGQPANMVARVFGADGSPQADASVLLVTSWGTLAVSDGTRSDAGSAVAVSTWIDGAVQASLLPRTGEPLAPAQQQAVEAMVSLLDTGADTPAACGEALQQMVREYRWEASVDFRSAVDVYMHEFRPQLLDMVVATDLLSSWKCFDATVFAYLPAEGAGPGGRVEAIAALPLRFRDWLGPFLQIFLEQLKPDAVSQTGLQSLVTQGRKPESVLSDLSSDMQGFLEFQRGFAGRSMALRALEYVVREKVLPGPDGQGLNAGLGSAVARSWKLLTTAAPEVASVVGGTRSELHQEIEGTTNGLEAKIGQKADITVTDALDKAIGGLTSSVADKVDKNTLDNALKQTVDANTFTTFHDEVSGALASKAEQSSLDKFTKDFSTALSLKAEKSAIDDLNKSVGALKDIVDAKADKKAVDVALANKIEKSDLGAFLKNGVETTDIKGLAETLQGLQTSLTKLNKKVFGV